MEQRRVPKGVHLLKIRIVLGCSVSAKDDLRDVTDIMIWGLNKLEEREVRENFKTKEFTIFFYLF